MVILGLQYDSEFKVCNLDPAKVVKYTTRIETVIRVGGTSSKSLERIVGNLGFAAWVEPFGRPLLSFLASHIIPQRPAAFIPMSPMMFVGFKV